MLALWLAGLMHCTLGFSSDLNARQVNVAVHAEHCILGHSHTHTDTYGKPHAEDDSRYPTRARTPLHQLCTAAELSTTHSGCTHTHTIPCSLLLLDTRCATGLPQAHLHVPGCGKDTHSPPVTCTRPQSVPTHITPCSRKEHWCVVCGHMGQRHTSQVRYWMCACVWLDATQQRTQGGGEGKDVHSRDILFSGPMRHALSQHACTPLMLCLTSDTLPTGMALTEPSSDIWCHTICPQCISHATPHHS